MTCEQEAANLALALADLVLAEIDVAIDTINLQLSWDAYYDAYAAWMSAEFSLYLCQNPEMRMMSDPGLFNPLQARRALIEIMRSGNVPPVKTDALLVLRKECAAYIATLKETSDGHSTK